MWNRYDILVQKRDKPSWPVWCRKKIFWCRIVFSPYCSDEYFIVVIFCFDPLRNCKLGRDLFLHQKIFFLHQTGPAGFSRFCTKIIFFSHQLGFFPAPKQFFSAPNDFGNCIWFCTKLILFLHQNDTKSLEAGTKLFWFCTKYFFDFFWFITKYIPTLHQFVTN